MSEQHEADAERTAANSYFRALFDAGRHGDAREESFYGPLATLVEAMATLHDKTGLHVTTLPKQTEAGNPDFRVWDGRARITGYIEAKKPGANLDQVETSDQLKRYLHTFPNVILTDFYEFRLYRDGQRLARVVAGQSFVPGTLKAPSPARDAEGLAELFGKFFSFSLPRRFTARTLAVELAKRTRFLRDEVVALELREQEKQGKGDILGFYHAFKDYLIADLSLEQFADLYAQTVTYGMFAARTRTKAGFDRRSAFDRIPRTIGLLRDLFQYISYGQLPEPLVWMVDDIAEVLAAADVKKLLDQFYREGKGRDPIVHFYETFLSEYDPKERERRGVYYTPEPVVGYIVRSVHALLKERFGKPDGLASEGVTLLDPAAGTMTFVAEAARVAAEEYENKYGDGKHFGERKHWLQDDYVKFLRFAQWKIDQAGEGIVAMITNHGYLDIHRRTPGEKLVCATPKSRSAGNVLLPHAGQRNRERAKESGPSTLISFLALMPRLRMVCPQEHRGVGFWRPVHNGRRSFSRSRAPAASTA